MQPTIIFFLFGNIISMKVLSKSPEEYNFRSSLLLYTTEFLMKNPVLSCNVSEQSKTKV